jgi:hypothetical protein
MVAPTSSFFEWTSKDAWIPTQFCWTDDGNIECQACPDTPVWCMHIERLTIENGDAEFMWQNFGEESAFGLQIPMFPTKSLWTRAELRYVSKVNAYIVFIQTEEGTEHVQMGYLHQGEGRNVIRQMILDWFDGRYGMSTTIKCVSASHKVSSEMAWVDAMKDDNKRILNFWSVWDTHTCVYCKNGEGDISDLIPDASSTRRPVF